MPSGGWTRYIYDKLDRVVLEQHAEQALQNKWSFTKYDVLGRVIQRGELVNSGTQSGLQSAFDGVNMPYEVWQGTAYSSQSFPITYNAVDVKNELYYDQYAWVNSALAFNASLAYHSQYSNAKGLATGSYARSPENVNEVFHTVLYYDNKGQVIQSQQTHHKGGSNLFTKPIITNFQYSFVGEVLAAKITYQVDGQSTISTLTTNEYDHAGRLLKVYHGINGIAPVEILRMTYDEIGRLSQKKILPNGSYYVGGTLDYINRPPSPNANIDDVAKKAVCLLPGTLINSNSVGHYSASINPNATTGMPISGLQTMDYQWHIRGGLRGINLDASGAVMPDSLQGDLFSFKLDYETGTPAGVGYYDGNIGKQTWRNVENNTKTGLRAYTYGYDAGSRLTAADYLGVSNENFSLPSISYNKNGGITKLRRYGKVGASYGLVDSLTYNYVGNRLTQITDTQGNNNGNEFVQNGAGLYTHYADGALKSDANEQIQNIIYDTFLKQPIELQLTDGRKIKNYYDGGGNLYKTVYLSASGAVVETWEFLAGGLVLKDGQPYQMPIPDGRAIYTSGGWQYEFDYKDHLGTTRVSFKANGNQLEKTAESSFDPWGVKLSVGVTNAVQNRWEFQNKASEQTFGLGRIDLGARTYNPKIGIEDRIDQLAELDFSFSPYSYAGNNPANFVDLFGLKRKKIHEDEFEETTPFDEVVVKGTRNTTSSEFGFDLAYRSYDVNQRLYGHPSPYRHHFQSGGAIAGGFVLGVPAAAYGLATLGTSAAVGQGVSFLANLRYAQAGRWVLRSSVNLANRLVSNPSINIGAKNYGAAVADFTYQYSQSGDIKKVNLLSTASQFFLGGNIIFSSSSAAAAGSFTSIKIGDMDSSNPLGFTNNISVSSGIDFVTGFLGNMTAGMLNGAFVRGVGDITAVYEKIWMESMINVGTNASAGAASLETKERYNIK